MTHKNRRQFLSISLGIALFVGGGTASGSGIIGRAARRSAVKRISSHKAKSVGEHPLSHAEKNALAKVLRELDQKTLVKIQKKHGKYIDPKQLEKARNCQTCFLSKQQYDRHLQKSYPALSQEQRKSIVGDYQKQLTVNRNSKNLPTTIAHERLHQLSSNGKGGTYKGRFGEGITEHFAKRIYGGVRIKGYPEAYPGEQRVIRIIEARVGEAPLAKAYYQGNPTHLKMALDRQLGKGSYEKIVRHTESGRPDLAERILLKKKWFFPGD